VKIISAKIDANADTKKTSFHVTIIQVVKSLLITLHMKSFAWISTHPWRCTFCYISAASSLLGQEAL